MSSMKDENKNPQNVEEEIMEAFDDVSVVPSTEDGDELPTKDVVKKLREDLAQARKDKEEYLTGWQRAKADYVNLQKSEAEKLKDVRFFVTTGLIEDLLPTLDSFDMAFANKETWEKVDPNWRSGVEYIGKQFNQALENYGVAKINQVGIKFDPTLHESVESIETDDQSKDHLIESVIQSGYKIGDKVIRPARVKIFEFKS